MENNFEKDLSKALNEEKEIPVVVRESLDNTYSLISKQKRRGWKVSVRRGIIAACCLIAVGTVFTNKSVLADIRALFNFHDKAIEQAVDNGFVQQDNSSAADQNVKVALDSYFCDSNKIGLSFRVKFDDTKLSEVKVPAVRLIYRIKNGDGQYIYDSDGKNTYMTNDSVSQPVLDSNNEIQYDMLLESLKGNIPELQNAVIEVVGISYADTNNERKTIEGAWNLALDNSNRQKNVEVEYAAQNNSSDIKVISAKMSPTAFNINFVLNMAYDQKHLPMLNGLILIDANGKQYIAKGYTWDDKDGKVAITASFPVSSYENINNITLHISDIGDNDSSGKYVPLMPGGDVVLIKK